MSTISNLTSLGFPEDVSKKVAPYLFPTNERIYGALKDLIPQIPQSLNNKNLEEKGFKLVGRGQSVCVLTHEKIKGYVIKVPCGTYVLPKHGFKRVRAHTYANQHIKERNTKSFIVSKNWLFPMSCTAEECKNYQEFKKQKKGLKSREGYHAKKIEGESLYRSFVIVEEHLKLLDVNKKTELFGKCFTADMITDQEAFLLAVGECDIHAGNLEFTEKGELVYVDLANWKKNGNKRLENGIWGFSKLHFYITDPSVKQFWANRTITLFEQTEDAFLFDTIFSTQLQEALDTLTTLEYRERLSTRMKSYSNKHIEEIQARMKEEKDKKIAAFIDSISLTIFYIFKRP